MAESLGRSVSAQENNVTQVDIREEYECTICLNWLNEPVVTSCGHRFCKACILSWLRRDESRCPIDNKLLDSERDIFVDNFTKRQIDQLVKPCPNVSSGCTKLLTTNELEAHLLVCEHNPSLNGGGSGGAAVAVVQCTFHYCGCPWKGHEKEELDEHLKQDLNTHLEMLVTSFRDGQNLNGMDNPRLWDAPPKRTNGGDSLATNPEQMDLIRGMYDRIVVLEQQFREQSVKLDKVSEELARSAEKEAQRYSDGVLVWRVSQFRSKVDSMRNNPNVLLYSHEAYTSPHGYKFCFRINIAPKCPRQLNLHFHLMQSENDYHLEWPFSGRIKIQMIHPLDFKLTQSDTIMSKQGIQAFYQPQHRISPRGFGFTEYAFIQDMFSKGFVDEHDSVTFKIQVSLV